MRIMLFSYSFDEKDSDKKALKLVPEYGTNACYKIS